jgi:hypothetical protein
MRLRGVWRRMVLVLMRLVRLMGLVGQMGLRMRRGMALLVNLLLICLSQGHAGADESLELRVGRLFRVGHNRSLDLPRASDRTCTTMLSMSMSGGGRRKMIRLLRRKRGEDGGLDVRHRSGIGALSILRIILLVLSLLLLLRIVLLWLVVGDRGLVVGMSLE